MSRPDLNVTFADGPNAAGIQQNACVLCGDCCLGCNYGAKNTVLMNYLPDAHAHGAQIFTEVAVRSVQRWQDTWRVVFDVLGAGRGRYGTAPSQFITADVVVLAAGTLGSTEILLRSGDQGLKMSERLGYGFSGNGDVLALAYDTSRQIRGVGLGRRVPRKHTAVGPTITGMIDLREEQPDRSKALIIEDGAIPGALAAILPAALYAASFGSPGGHGASSARRLREFAEIPLGSYHGPVDRTLTYLVMSTDDSGGRLGLENDRIQVTWPEVAEQPVFARDNRILTMATEALHGTPVPDPLWAWTNGRSLITVHPLGGCVVADEAASGVVDHTGRVFTGDGEGVYEGLYVADGSVIPVALDANPLLTIAAIAERTAEIMIRERGWGAGADNARPAPPTWAAPPSSRAPPSSAVRLATEVPLARAAPPQPLDVRSLEPRAAVAGLAERGHRERGRGRAGKLQRDDLMVDGVVVAGIDAPAVRAVVQRRVQGPGREVVDDDAQRPAVRAPVEQAAVEPRRRVGAARFDRAGDAPVRGARRPVRGGEVGQAAETRDPQRRPAQDVLQPVQVVAGLGHQHRGWVRRPRRRWSVLGGAGPTGRTRCRAGLPDDDQGYGCHRSDLPPVCLRRIALLQWPSNSRLCSNSWHGSNT